MRTTVKIIQIMPIHHKGESIPLKLPDNPMRADHFRTPQIIGLALVEDEDCLLYTSRCV